MNDLLKKFLFARHILVGDTHKGREECFCTLFTLANKFGIRIVEGADLACADMIPLAAEQLGQYVPEPFYRGFPESVRQLTPEEVLFDQLYSYALTYGLNDFSQARHSVFEEPFDRIAFREGAEVKPFRILPEEAAVKELDSSVDQMLASTRPLSEEQLDVLGTYVVEYRKEVLSCGSKDTAADLILRCGDASYARLLKLPDVIRLAETMNYRETGEENIKKLDLRNQQRKLIARVLDTVLENADPVADVRDCFEKRALWNGLLHHIHYSPRSAVGKYFVGLIRNSRANLSAYSEFERLLSAGFPVSAAEALRRSKGSGALVRKLNYVLSRCAGPGEVERVLDALGPVSPILSIQMILQYQNYASARRVFKFIRFGKMARHTETDEEKARRRSVVSEEICAQVAGYMQRNLKNVLSKEKIGKVYIDPAMKKIALPLQEAASSSGFGVLPRGTRLPIPEGKKIRCFTYWEKVDDIDLSAFGITDDNRMIEFSWRTAGDFNGRDCCIVYSGDVTSGRSGGSEYFDVDPEAFREQYPNVRYIVFADNVYWGGGFDQCVCRAGYMVREKEGSGEIFEPKTVKTSFAITGSTTYALLFALDVAGREAVWLNIAMDHSIRVAGTDDLSFVLPYMDILDTASVYTLFEAKAAELTDDPAEADVIVSDETFGSLKEGQQQIHSYDHEKLLAYLNRW